MFLDYLFYDQHQLQQLFSVEEVVEQHQLCKEHQVISALYRQGEQILMNFWAQMHSPFYYPKKNLSKLH